MASFAAADANGRRGSDGLQRLAPQVVSARAHALRERAVLGYRRAALSWGHRVPELLVVYPKRAKFVDPGAAP